MNRTRPSRVNRSPFFGDQAGKDQNNIVVERYKIRWDKANHFFYVPMSNGRNPYKSINNISFYI